MCIVRKGVIYLVSGDIETPLWYQNNAAIECCHKGAVCLKYLQLTFKANPYVLSIDGKALPLTYGLVILQASAELKLNLFLPMSLRIP